MSQSTHLECYLHGIIAGHLEYGRTDVEASENLRITQSVVSKLWQRFQDDGSVIRHYSTSFFRVKTTVDNRHLEVTAKM